MHPVGARRGPGRLGVIDWPTLAAIALFWVALVALGFGSAHLPTIVVLGGLVLLGGFYMSLQHEVIHGHPTRWRAFNRLLVGAPLGLIHPYARYNSIHLAHHNSNLTDPVVDPESFYVLPATWADAGQLQRLILRVNRTLAGRLLLGPFLSAWHMLRWDLHLTWRNRDVRRAWFVHAAASLLVLAIVFACPLPSWMFVLGFVYGGASMSALRSFVEHRAVPGAERSAIVYSNWFFGLLFLNNNLHNTHHELPGAAWFHLPALTRTFDADEAVASGAGVYRGYAAIIRRHLFRPFDQPMHPLSETVSV